MMTLTYVRLCLMVFILSLTSIEGVEAFQDDIQKIQIDFTTPNGYVRHLLLGFTPDNAASDGVDYGYDAANIDTFPDDLNWMIEEKRFVIQGVGAFDDTKKFPLGLFLKNSGDIKIELIGTYLIDSSVNIFIYDSVQNTYTNINESKFSQNIASGEYTDRYYIAFQDDSAIEQVTSLSIDQNTIKNTVVKYLSTTKDLYINTNSPSTIKQIQIYNILGKELFSVTNLNNSEIRIPIENLRTNYGIVSVTTEQGIISKKIVLR